MDLNIPIAKTLLQPGELKKAKALLGFDLGTDLYHVYAFVEGDGAIGIVREGDNFCARLGLDSLALFYRQAKADHTQGGA